MWISLRTIAKLYRRQQHAMPIAQGFYINFDNRELCLKCTVDFVYSPLHNTGTLIDGQHWFPPDAHMFCQRITTGHSDNRATFLVLYTRSLSTYFREQWDLQYTGQALVMKLSSLPPYNLVPINASDETSAIIATKM